MSIIARNSLMSGITADRIITPGEIARILGLLFDESTPRAQVKFEVYKTVDHYLDSGLRSDRFEIVDATPGDDFNQNQYLLYNLIQGFPGNLTVFREHLQKVYHIQTPALDEDLPQMLLQDFYADTTRKNILHIVFQIDGHEKPQDLTFDTARGKWTMDPLAAMLGGDVLQEEASALLLDKARTSSDAGGFNSEQAKLYALWARSLHPFPERGRDLAEDRIEEAELMGADCTEVSDHYDVFSEAQRVTQTDSLLPVYTDSSISSTRLGSLMTELKKIFGEDILNFLAETPQSLHFGVFDFDALADASQLQYADSGAPVHDFMAEIKGLYVHENRCIWVDSAQSFEVMLYTAVHEIAHALNFLVQDKSNLHKVRAQQPPLSGLGISGKSHYDYKITGAQADLFYQRVASSDNYFEELVSGYSARNEAEWMAELSAQYFLDKAGRLDLLDYLTDHNPRSSQSPEQADAAGYKLIDTIVRTIQNRHADPQAYAALMANGIDAKLAKACDPNYQPDQMMADVLAYFNNRTDPDVAAKFIEDATGKVPSQKFIDIFADFAAIRIAVQLSRTDWSHDDKAQFLADEGYYNQQKLDELYDFLICLKPEVLNPLFSQELLVQAQLIHTLNAREYSVDYQFQVQRDRSVRGLIAAATDSVIHDDLVAARASITAAEKLDPDNAAIRAGFFVLLAFEKKYAALKVFWQQQEKDDGSGDEFKALLGWIKRFDQAGRHDQSIILLQALLRVDPYNLGVLRRLSDEYAAIGDKKNAQKFEKKAQQYTIGG